MRPFVRWGAVILALILLGVTPLVLAGAVMGWPGLEKGAVYAFFVALYATVFNGRRVGVGIALLFAVFTAVGTQVHSSAIGGAVVVGLSAVLICVLATRGLTQVMLFVAMFIPYSIALPAPAWEGTSVTSSTYVLAILAAAFASGMWGLVVGGVIHDRLPGSPPIPGADALDALLAGALLVPAVAAITYVSMTWFPETKWVWLLAALYTLIKPGRDLNWPMTRDLVVGTVVGVTVAAVIVAVGLATGVMLLLGSLVMCAALSLRMMNRPYWVYAGVVTAAAVLMTGAGMDPVEAWEDRLIYTVLGAIAAVALGAAITWVVHVAHLRRGARALAGPRGSVGSGLT